MLSEPEEKSCTGWMTHQVASCRSANCPLWANRPSNDPVAVGNVRDSGPGPRNHCAGVSYRRRSMSPEGQPSCPWPYWRCPPKRVVRGVVVRHPGTWGAPSAAPNRQILRRTNIVCIGESGYVHPCHDYTIVSPFLVPQSTIAAWGCPFASASTYSPGRYGWGVQRGSIQCRMMKKGGLALSSPGR